MPELPEVEVAARSLRAWAGGRRVEAVQTDRRAARIFRPGTGPALARALTGRSLAEVRRVGKHLLLTLGGGPPLGLVSHLGMTGKWLRRAEGEEAPPHSRARLRLDDGAWLHYQDPRLFGRLRLVPGARFEALADLAALGPDPLDEGVDPERLRLLLGRTARPVKVALLDQRLLPGVGNIHASEACFRAGIDPRRAGRRLAASEIARLAGAVLDSLRQGLQDHLRAGPEIEYVEEGGQNPFLVYAREGEPCPRCRKGALRRIVQAQRATFLCPRCQR